MKNYKECKPQCLIHRRDLIHDSYYYVISYIAIIDDNSAYQHKKVTKILSMIPLFSSPTTLNHPSCPASSSLKIQSLLVRPVWLSRLNIVESTRKLAPVSLSHLFPTPLSRSLYFCHTGLLAASSLLINHVSTQMSLP